MICLCGLCVWVAYLYYVYVYVCFTSGDDNTAENFVYVLRPHNVWGADGKQEFISWLKHFRGTKEMPLCFVKYIYEKNISTDRQLSKNKHKKLLWSILVPWKGIQYFFWIYKRILFVLLISLYLFIENKKKMFACACVSVLMDALCATRTDRLRCRRSQIMNPVSALKMVIFDLTFLFHSK